jgi:fumarate hydratase subunit beta
VSSLAKVAVRLSTPLDRKAVLSLRAGDEVFLTGVVFTARDQVHRRLAELIKKGKRLPLSLKDQVIYYCGPTRKAPGNIFGSCGPTTSSRMDHLTAPLLSAGLKGMIGKGRRSEAVQKLIKKHKAVYFLAIGGAGALLSRKVIAARPVCFKELGPEAVYELYVKDFPLTVGIDSKGRDIFNIHNETF